MIAVRNFKASEEVANLIATIDPAKVIAFRPSAETAERVSELIDLEKNDQISDDEKYELDHYMQLEHLMRMAKILARKHSATK